MTNNINALQRYFDEDLRGYMDHLYRSHEKSCENEMNAHVIQKRLDDYIVSCCKGYENEEI